MDETLHPRGQPGAARHECCPAPAMTAGPVADRRRNTRPGRRWTPALQRQLLRDASCGSPRARERDA